MKNQNEKVQDEKQDAMEKSEIISANICDQLSKVSETHLKDPTPVEMEGALKKLSLSDNNQIKTEPQEVSAITLENEEVQIIDKPTLPVPLQELENITHNEATRSPQILPPNKPSEIRIAQVHESFASNVMTTNQRAGESPYRTQDQPPPLFRPTQPFNVAMRSTMPRISSVTSLHRPFGWENAPARPTVQKPHRLPSPIASRSNLFDESSRFKYRESL